MKWNLRLAAASRGIWKASELQKMLAARGLVISAGKMSGLWSGNPNAVKLADLDVICAVHVRPRVAIPLTCGPRTEKGPSGFPLSFTPRRAGPSSACQGGDGPRHCPKSRRQHR